MINTGTNNDDTKKVYWDLRTYKCKGDSYLTREEFLKLAEMTHKEIKGMDLPKEVQIGWHTSGWTLEVTK